MSAPEIIRLATRGSPLALRQTELTIAHLSAQMPETEFEVVRIKTTGDKQKHWNLEKKGGKGLFTKELELALLVGEADIAVHSAKDLPTEEPGGLVLAGFLPRAPAHDILVVRNECKEVRFVATGSPRRRSQLKNVLPCAVWSEIRGNVDTRLKKVASGTVDATVLAAAGLARLGINEWPGVEFRPFTPQQVVPAVGQGAVALQVREDDRDRFAPYLCEETAQAVSIERLLLKSLGGGCHTAVGGYFDGEKLHVYHEQSGRREFPLTEADLQEPDAVIAQILRELEIEPASDPTDDA